MIVHAEMIRKTLIDIAYEDRERLVAIMQQALSDSLSLYLGAKQAHWNVKGRDFLPLHDLFEEVASEAATASDKIAERASALGGTPLAISQVAQPSRIQTYFFNSNHADDHIYMVMHAAAHCANDCREFIETCEQLKDKVSADMFTDICAALDHLVWKLEAHMN